jgi:SAM-dependent methyltransferase
MNSTLPTKEAQIISWLNVPVTRMIYYTDYIGTRLTGKIVLDVGCGRGIETLFYALYWNTQMITGIDNYGNEGGVPKNKAIFLNNIAETGCQNIRLIEADAFNMPIAPESIDVIIVSQAMHHIFYSSNDLRRVNHAEIDMMAKKLRHWYDLLAPGGKLIVRETYRYCLQRMLTIFPRFRSNVRYETKQEPDGWIRLLSAAGFVVEDCFPYVPYRLRQFTPLFRNRITCFFVTTFYTILALKNNK